MSTWPVRGSVNNMGPLTFGGRVVVVRWVHSEVDPSQVHVSPR